jgi:hypothetical protein
LQNARDVNLAVPCDPQHVVPGAVVAGLQQFPELVLGWVVVEVHDSLRFVQNG